MLDNITNSMKRILSIEIENDKSRKKKRPILFKVFSFFFLLLLLKFSCNFNDIAPN